MTESSLLNPFAVGPAVGGATGRGFIGREDIFSFINSALASETRAPVLLYGQRRIGKSSILKQIPRHVPEGLVCIFFDLQGTASMKVSQVLYGLGIEIAQKTGAPKPSREECAEENFPTFLSSVIAKAGGEQRLVLLFDEFDVIDERAAGPEIAASRFIPYLAGLSGRFPGIGLVLVVGRKPEELSPAFLGALLKDSIVKPIGRLTEEQTMTLASDLSAGYLRFDTAALDRIYYLTRGHPFCAQALCNVIWNRAITVDRALPVRVTPEAVDAALPQALQLWSNGFNWVYDGMSTPAHRLLLSALADLSSTSGWPPGRTG